MSEAPPADASPGTAAPARVASKKLAAGSRRFLRVVLISAAESSNNVVQAELTASARRAARDRGEKERAAGTGDGSAAQHSLPVDQIDMSLLDQLTSDPALCACSLVVHSATLSSALPRLCTCYLSCCIVVLHPPPHIRMLALSPSPHTH